uniref:Uncharacterized protein n=1 Tax=viral metagenome TaxID=1070528 RepID=A0A6C0LQI1_9ZZZZ
MEVLQEPITLIPQTAIEGTAPDSQTRRRKIHCKQELIVMSLQAFYSSRKDLQEVIELLQGTSLISLRLIDWFVTNYAKRHSIGYLLEGQEFMVYMSYKSQLKAYSKKLFDPFCRRERIMFSLPGVEPFVTTVGKLNFFRWAIEKNIIEYLKKNQEVVETEMNAHMKQLSRSRSTRTGTDSSTGSSASVSKPGTATTTSKRVRTTFQTALNNTVCHRVVDIKVEFD